jgi:uncharacterized membrane protein (GlpM family)
MALLLKGIAGAVVVVIVQLVAKADNYYIAGLVPLFPTLTLISHYVVGTSRTPAELKQTILFGILSMLPYLAYMVVLYLLVGRWRLGWALAAGVASWAISAAALVVIWQRVAVA